MQSGEPQEHGAQALYEYIIDHVLCAAMKGEARVIDDVSRFGRSLRFEQGSFYFTLPDLYEFAVARGAHAHGAIDYRSFLRLLYHQPTNTVLRQRGCSVEVVQSNPQHALSVYRLVLCNSE